MQAPGCHTLPPAPPLTQLFGLAHAIVEQQVVILLALIDTHAGALQVAQDAGDLHVLLGL